MPGDGSADQDIFQLWLESSRSVLDAGTMPESLRERCEALFAAWARFARTYAEAGGTAALNMPEGGPFDPMSWLGAGGASGLGDLWRWFAAPEGADPLEAERDLLRASKQGVAYARALERYNTVMGTAWIAAFRRFTDGLAREHEAGAGPPPWEEVERRWREAADDELAKAQRSEAFLSAQRDLIRARLDFSAVLRGRIEAAAGPLGLPTRAELDELHRAVHELRREIRALRGRRGGA